MPSLTTYRRTIAPLIGVFETGTADASSTTSQLVCTTTLASGAQFTSSAFPASLYNGKWIYLPGAAADDRSRLLKTSAGYDPTNGYALPDKDWGASVGGLSDRTFEITSVFSGPDLNALVNAALQKMFVLRDLTVTVTSQNVRRHQLNAAAPWLKSAAWVYQLGHLGTGESRDGTALVPATDPYRRLKWGDLEDRAGEVWVTGPTWLPTDTVYALCACRAYDLCRPAAGTYGAQSGLSLETDEAPVDAEWLAWVAIAEAANRLDHLERTGEATQQALASRRMAAERVSSLTKQWWRPPDRTFRPRPVYAGPALAGVRGWRRRW